MKRQRFCCEDLSKIENYDKAKADNFKGWAIHHRLETHTIDGKRREVDLTVKELIDNNMYYHRPASELIFLTVEDHISLHTTGKKYFLGKHHSKETKRKISESHKGEHFSEEHKKHLSEKSAWKGTKGIMFGKQHSEEAKDKMSKSWDYNKHFSEETKRKMSEAHKGKSCQHSEETKKKIAEACKGIHWYNNGEINVRAKECPAGFVPGRLSLGTNS